MLTRPRPPERLLGTEGFLTERPVDPAYVVMIWMRETFIDEGDPLFN